MRTRRITRTCAPLLAAAIAYAALVRPRLLTWGATPEEVGAHQPGDDVVPHARATSTMATTLPAAPADVWPWLVQMGCDRAGFYSWDRLDNGGRPSATRIHPDWQDLRQGGRVLCLPSGAAWFDVALLEPPRALVLRSSMSFTGRHFDPTARPPRAFSDSTWGFFLRPTAGGGTRLVVRGLGRSRPLSLTGPLDWLFWEPAHWIMQRRQFAQLRRRVRAATPPASVISAA
jgi:proline iminopeptidase